MGTTSNPIVIDPATAFVAYRDRKPGETWASVAASLGFPEVPFRRAAWRGEVIVHPDLKVDPTGENVVKLRSEGLRWEHIAIRTDLTVGKVRTLYGKTTGVIPETTLAAKGRKWAEAREGHKPLGDANAKQFLDGVTVSRKEVPKGRGDQGHVTRAHEIIDANGKPARRTARRSK